MELQGISMELLSENACSMCGLGTGLLHKRNADDGCCEAMEAIPANREVTVGLRDQHLSGCWRLG